MRMKKILAMTLAMLMTVSSVGMTAMAEEDLTAKIIITNEITNTGIDLTGKEFSVYQIFSATIDNEVAEASISYTLVEEFEGFFENKSGINSESISNDAETYVHTAYDNGTLQDLVAELETYINENSITVNGSISGSVTTNSGVQSLSSGDLAAGYYLVLDESTNGSTISAGMLASIPTKDSNSYFTQNATISLKGSQPQIEKEIWHNDLNTVGDWDTVGDYEIGDTVSFLIKAGMPSDLTGYTDYTYIITDTMSEGITFKLDSLKIYADEALQQEAAGDHHVTTKYTDDSSGKIFTIEFDMLAIKEKFPSMTEFYIVYEGTLNEESVIALESETNTVELQYSNNPYESSSYGYDEDTVYSYTFDMDVLKTDTTSINPLADAVFSLWVNPKDESEADYQVYLKQDETEITIYYVQQSGTPDLANYSGYVKTDSNGAFTIKGLDDSLSYILREEEAPNGYSKAQDVLFEITATYKDTTVPTITVNNSAIKVEADGSLSTTVINTSSELFPGTGGMGTTIFIIVGSVMMLLAVILLVVNRRKEYKE